MKRWTFLSLLLILGLVLVACGGTEAPPADTGEEATPAPTEESMEESGQTIVDIAAGNPDFATLVTALDAAGLTETLAGEGEFTVFAPTNAAFTNLPEGALDDLLADPEGALTDVLLYHVADGAVMAADVTGMDTITTLQGEPITVEVVDGNVVLNGVATVTQADIEASNGVIHVIDAVLLPPSMAEADTEAAPSIAELAAADENLSTLVTALDAAGLTETLAGEGEFTVFAPTNDAFAALPEGTLDELLADPQGALTSVLLYHVAEGTLTAADVVELTSIPTLAGQEITVEVTDSGVVLNGNVNVVTTDIQASNGVIHVIDGVLLLPSEGDEEAMQPTIAEIAASDENFSTLVTALDAAGLTETLAGEGPFTVFAPTNDAFAALPEGTLDELLADPQGALTDVLLYHVAEGAVPASEVVNLDAVPTLAGSEISVTVTDSGVVLNDSVNVTMTDIEASNGIIHVIDGVLLPPAMGEDESMADEESMASGTIAEIAAGNEDFSTLVTALDAAGLVETLNGEGEYTVFAPTNEAFAALPEGTLDTLLADPQGALTDILLYHVVEGEAMAADVVELPAVTTLQGDEISILVTDDGVVLNGNVNVTMTDIDATNGVIHVIDGVLIPPQ